ncbi:MAG: guanylate kinase [Lachnospiraceae bacterium]|nr:guanylate kinase [Lachnospiraceae bacterium]
MQKGILTVISGFSGAGKGTLMKTLLSRYDDYALSVSMTTRAPRPGEIDGKDYFFVTVEEFEKSIAEGKLVEYARYVDNYYGTPADYVFEQLKKGKNVLLEIEIQGALQIKEKFPDALLLFITTPSAKVLEERLRGRGTETEEVIRKRLERAATEAADVGKYEYIIVNDVLEEAAESMHNIITNSKFATSRNARFIKDMKSGIDSLLKGE